jgi:predicted regulator of Ras-like GTPase activity (Roadblock/LC7/MglB family)
MPDLKLDDASIEEGLREAEELSWSGILRVLSGREQIGAIVVREGRVAWAVCRYQHEDLGAFLVRQGVLSRERLAEVRQRYEALGRTRKLGALLAEAGVSDPATLHERLRQHVRRTLRCMLALEGCTLSARGGALKVDEELSFSLASLLGEDRAAQSSEPAPTSLSALSAVLQDLAVLPGYRGSLVAQLDGRVLAADGLDARPGQSMLHAGLASALLRAATQIAADAQLGSLSAGLLEGANGALLTRWVLREMGVFLALFLSGEGRLGVAKQRATAATTALYPLVAAIPHEGSREPCNE